MTTPDAQELESFFQQLTTPPPAQPGEETDAMRQFNSLFQKLSALEELTLEPQLSVGRSAGADDANAAERAATMQQGAPAADAAATQAAASNPQPGDILPVPTSLDGPETPAAAARPSGAQRLEEALAARRRQRAKRQAKGGMSNEGLASAAAAAHLAPRLVAKVIAGDSRRRRIVHGLKVATIGLVLFGLGLGGVWLALSFPQRFEGAVPNISGVLAPNNGTARSAAGAAGTPATMQAQQPAISVAPAGNRSSGQPAPFASASSPDVRAALTGNLAEFRPVELTETTGKGARSAAAQTSALPAPTAMDAAAPAGASGARYAIQVGACASVACLDNYRKLLLPLVGNGTIHYAAIAPAQGGKPVHRVRVEPLALDEARRLKDHLAASDARLRGAYVVTLN